MSDLAIFLSGLGITFWLVAIVVMATEEVIPTPRRWPLAFTVATYAVAPLALLPALLVATTIRLALPTQRDEP